MNSLDIPERWFDTLEEAPVKEWLDDDEFPFDTAENMISYLKYRGDDALDRMLLDDTGVPQSFAHWWCHVRVARRDGPERPVYPCMERWLPIVSRWKQVTAQPIDIIGTFKIWLDALFIDVSIYSDEHQRPNVPRLKNGRLQWRSQLKKAPLKKSRRDTIAYIMDEGYEFFHERGWAKGETYWEQQCKKYSVLFS